MAAPVKVRVHVTIVELSRLRAIEAEAAQLVRKLDEHETRGWERIALGALHRLRDAYRMGQARDGLSPEPGSTAARLDALYPDDGEEA